MTNDEFLSKYAFKELTEDVLAECECNSVPCYYRSNKNSLHLLHPMHLKMFQQ